MLRLPGWLAGILAATALLVGSTATFAQSMDGSDALRVDAEPRESRGEASFGSILGAIEDLESERDAKCQATATRLENFVSGTPLDDAARFEKIHLQKALIRSIWEAASREASNAGRDQVELTELRPAIARVLGFVRSENGDARVTVASGEVLTIPAIDFQHYGSVAYALRAILAVQQDALLDPSIKILPADDASLQALQDFVDVYTLAALQLADVRARRESESRINDVALASAWRAVSNRAPQLAETAGVALTSASATPGDTLRAIAEAKISAYGAYNGVGGKDREVFFVNARRYYARFLLPKPGPALGRLHQSYLGYLNGFVFGALDIAQSLAEVGGKPVVGAEEMHRAVQRITPHRIDDFEDAHFFPHLRQDQQVYVESYDMDSFRDLGVHWKAIQDSLNSPAQPLRMEIDPFAAEILAEGVAQFGVLLYRLAGEVAANGEKALTLTPRHLAKAAEITQTRARLDRDAPRTPARPPTIVSASGGAEGGGQYVTDITEQIGLRFEHRSSPWLSRFRRSVAVSPPTFSGGGVAAEDIDGDGYPDLLFVGGAGNLLLRNDGAGGFENITKRSGIDFRRSDGSIAEARQPVIADFDNDGRQDILITYADDSNRLYRNLGDGTFDDVTAKSGLGGNGSMAGPATVFDFDRDGLLDVYIGYFGDYLRGYRDLEVPPSGAFKGELPGLARDNKNGLPNQLLRNLGEMRFEDVTEASGTGDLGWAQAVSHTDFDGDGWQDLIVANDYGKNAFLRNRGDGTFDDVSESLGIIYAYHSMNVGIADMNDDMFPDVYISNINTFVKDTKYVLPTADTPAQVERDAMARMRIEEASILYVSVVEDRTLQRYVGSDSLERGEISVGWAWDADFFDIENDGDDDLYVLNGTNDYYVYRNTKTPDGEKVPLYDHTRESNVLFVNEQSTLRNRTVGSGAELLVNSRAATYLDYDRDGDLDIAINNFHTSAVFLRNDAEARGGNWISIRLIGDPEKGSNRDAIGARIVAKTPRGNRVWREVRGGTGYLSSHPKEVHVGLGDERVVDIEIRWPGGSSQVLRGLEAQGRYVIREGAPDMERLGMN